MGISEMVCVRVIGSCCFCACTPSSAPLVHYLQLFAGHDMKEIQMIRGHSDSYFPSHISDGTKSAPTLAHWIVISRLCRCCTDDFWCENKLSVNFPQRKNYSEASEKTLHIMWHGSRHAVKNTTYSKSPFAQEPTCSPVDLTKWAELHKWMI